MFLLYIYNILVFFKNHAENCDLILQTSVGNHQEVTTALPVFEGFSQVNSNSYSDFYLISFYDGFEYYLPSEYNHRGTDLYAFEVILLERSRDTEIQV